MEQGILTCEIGKLLSQPIVANHCQHRLVEPDRALRRRQFYWRYSTHAASRKRGGDPRHR